MGDAGAAVNAGQVPKLFAKISRHRTAPLGGQWCIKAIRALRAVLIRVFGSLKSLSAAAIG
jgi:hypothetical protein